MVQRVAQRRSRHLRGVLELVRQLPVVCGQARDDARIARQGQLRGARV
jgi:hypothetical protein